MPTILLLFWSQGRTSPKSSMQTSEPYSISWFSSFLRYSAKSAMPDVLKSTPAAPDPLTEPTIPIPAVSKFMK
ncbi:MAG: hypothetical protein A3E40_01100 [Candidatus Levybacteria bacterium RIFCSPHIGHO2_12_FULL_37_9]|nr:MAG: hypothetical protein A3E40_01100 [Candidatus Levybacteria bacterium RIFCSPHIGHO2_12_FULL_37_9]